MNKIWVWRIRGMIEGKLKYSEGNMHSITVYRENNTLISMEVSPDFRWEGSKIFNASKCNGTTGVKVWIEWHGKGPNIFFIAE